MQCLWHSGGVCGRCARRQAVAGVAVVVLVAVVALAVVVVGVLVAAVVMVVVGVAVVRGCRRSKKKMKMKG